VKTTHKPMQEDTESGTKQRREVNEPTNLPIIPNKIKLLWRHVRWMMTITTEGKKPRTRGDSRSAHREEGNDISKKTKKHLKATNNRRRHGEGDSCEKRRSEHTRQLGGGPVRPPGSHNHWRIDRMYIGVEANPARYGTGDNI